jgi:colicin import membrane protein
METTSDKTRAYLYAFAVHLAVFAMLFLGLFWAKAEKPVVFAGAVIEADLVGKVGAPAHSQPKPTPAPPKPTPTPEPPAPPEPPKPPKPDPVPPKSTPTPPKPEEVKQPAPTVPHNDNKTQEKIDELALQKAEKAEKAQEAKHKQEQIELEQKQREEAEAKAQKQAEVQKQLDDIRKERAAAAKQTKLQQEKLKQLDDLSKAQSQPAAKPSKAPPVDAPLADERHTGANGDDTSLLAEYQSAIQKVVTDNWNRPDTASAGVRCAVRIIQIPGGTVISANVVSPCNADAVTRTSITNAVTKAQPLPFKGYEKVFQREVTFIFKYDGN